MKVFLYKYILKNHLLRNKYLLTVMLFILWVVLLDHNNFFKRHELKQEIRNLEKSKEFYISKIKDDSLNLRELENNNDLLEKFARENYLMKKKNEDIFIIVDENNKGIED